MRNNLVEFKTESGSEYVINDGMVRRVNSKRGKRADGEWVRLINDPVIEVGARAVLVVESLRRFGPDDLKTGDELAADYSTRITSEIVEVSK